MRTRTTPQLMSARLQRARHLFLVLFLFFLQASVVRCSAIPDTNSNLRNNLEHLRNSDSGDSKRCPLDSPLPPLPPPPQQQQPPNRPGDMEAIDAAAKKAVGDVGAETTIAAGGCVQAEKTIPERIVVGCNGDRVEAARR